MSEPLRISKRRRRPCRSHSSPRRRKARSTTVAAQRAGDNDLKEISAYTWTKPKFKQLMTAMANLGKAAMSDPIAPSQDLAGLTLGASLCLPNVRPE